MKWWGVMALGALATSGCVGAADEAQPPEAAAECVRWGPPPTPPSSRTRWRPGVSRPGRRPRRAGLGGRLRTAYQLDPFNGDVERGVAMSNGIFLLSVLAMALAWVLTSRRRERPAGRPGPLGRGRGQSRSHPFDAAVLTPLRASLRDDAARRTGWARIAGLDGGCTRAALARRTRRRGARGVRRQEPWAALAGWAGAVALFAVAHPITGDGRQARALTMAEVLAVLVSVGLGVGWYRRAKQAKEAPGSAHFALALIVTAERCRSWAPGAPDRSRTGRSRRCSTCCCSRCSSSCRGGSCGSRGSRRSLRRRLDARGLPADQAALRGHGGPALGGQEDGGAAGAGDGDREAGEEAARPHDAARGRERRARRAEGVREVGGRRAGGLRARVRGPESWSWCSHPAPGARGRGTGRRTSGRARSQGPARGLLGRGAVSPPEAAAYRARRSRAVEKHQKSEQQRKKDGRIRTSSTTSSAERTASSRATLRWSGTSRTRTRPASATWRTRSRQSTIRTRRTSASCAKLVAQHLHAAAEGRVEAGRPATRSPSSARSSGAS